MALGVAVALRLAEAAAVAPAIVVPRGESVAVAGGVAVRALPPAPAEPVGAPAGDVAAVPAGVAVETAGDAGAGAELPAPAGAVGLLVLPAAAVDDAVAFEARAGVAV